MHSKSARQPVRRPAERLALVGNRDALRAETDASSPKPERSKRLTVATPSPSAHRRSACSRAVSAGPDARRYDLVVDTRAAFNADLFVFQEVAGPTFDGRYSGALDQVTEDLTPRKAGSYVVAYTQAGGEQRVAIMWDRDWLRAKTDVTDLFAVGTHETADGKDAFAQRTPLHGFFAARIPTGASPDTKLGGGAEKFDFQVLGVHVKAMAEGHAQRSRSAAVLTDWMTVSAPKVDADVMFMGDWSAPPHHRCWTPSHALEATPNASVAFRGTNDPSDFSYLWLANRNDKYVSRIDLTAMSLSSMHQVAGDVATVVRWKPIEDVLAEAQNLHSNEVKAVMQELKELVSDHMPTVSRFYFP